MCVCALPVSSHARAGRSELQDYGRSHRETQQLTLNSQRGLRRIRQDSSAWLFCCLFDVLCFPCVCSGRRLFPTYAGHCSRSAPKGFVGMIINSDFLGSSLLDMRIPPLEIKTLLESNPLESRISVRRLAVGAE